MRRNGKPKSFSNADAMHAQVNPGNHRFLAHFKYVRRRALITRVEDGHVVLVVTDIMINDAIARVDALAVAIALFLNRFLEAAAIITTLNAHV